MASVGRIVLATAALILLIALNSRYGLPSPQDVPAAGAHQGQCRFGEPGATVVQTDHRFIYVNPMGIGVHGDRVAFSGTPNYLWKDTAAITGQIFSLVVDREGGARIIPQPSGAFASQALWAPDPVSGWRAAFPARARSSGQPNSTVLRTAAWDGSWSDSENVRLPESLWLDEFDPGTAAFVAGETEQWIALVAEPREHLVVFGKQGVDAKWRARVGSPNTVFIAADADSRGVVVAYIEVSPTSGNRLMAVRPFASDSQPRELYRWPGALTVNSLQAVLVGDSLVVLVGEDVPTLYVFSSGNEVERLRTSADSSETKDAFLSVLPNGNPILVTQLRRLEGGEAAISIRSIHNVELFETESPFAALQAVISTQDDLVLIGTTFPLGASSSVFATSVARVSVSCTKGGRK